MGGSGQYSWSASGLPSTFFVYGNQLLSTGTAPTNPETYQVTLTVTDTSSGQSGTKTLPLTVNPNYATVYLHRYYNSDPEVVDHFYTNNFQTAFCGKNGWFYEGTIGALATTPNSLRAPLYEYWNASIGHHFYTTNSSEVHQGDGFQFEGIVGYVYTQQVQGTVPLFRFWSPDAGDHMYTTDPTEFPYPPRPPRGSPSAPLPPQPLPYIGEGSVGYVLYPAPFVDGCGNLHNEKVRHGIAHAFEMKRQAAIVDLATWAGAAYDYNQTRRDVDSTDTVLRDVEYFLIGFRAANEPDALQRLRDIYGNAFWLPAYNALKLIGQLGPDAQAQVQLLLEYYGASNGHPPSEPGGMEWFGRGLLAGVSGSLVGESPRNPVLPDPDTSLGYEPNLHFVVGPRGTVANDPIYLDPPFDTDIEWTLNETPGVFVRTIVVPNESATATASFSVTVNGGTFPLSPGVPFDFARDAGASDVSTFSIRAIDEQSGGTPDYVLGVTFSGPAPFAWMKQKITPLAVNHRPAAQAGQDQFVEATSADGAIVQLDSAGSFDSDGDPLTFSWSGPFGMLAGAAASTVLPLGTHTVVLTADDGRGGVGTDTVAVTVGDTTTPLLTIPQSFTVDAPDPAGIAVSFATSAVDAVDGPVPVSCSHASGSVFAPGLTTVTCRASDARGNALSRSFTIRVRDMSPPTSTPPLGTFYGIGDLHGGPPDSVVRDATRVDGVIYAVGGSAANLQALCGAPNDPPGCVAQFSPDTAVLWTRDAAGATLTALPDLVVPNLPPANPLLAFAITPDARYIASRARSSATFAAQAQAVRVTRAGLTTLNLSAAPFPAQAPPTAATAISDDGSVLYGAAGNPSRAIRFDVNASTSTILPLLLESDTGSTPARGGASADGSVMVGTSFPAPSTRTNGRAFRYAHSTGAVSPIPLLTGGTWNNAIAVSPDGRIVLVAGNSTFLPNGEMYLYDAVSGTTTPLGSPNTPWTPLSVGGVTADGTVVATFGDLTVPDGRRHAYVRNAHGWFHLTTVLAAQGIDISASGWDSEEMSASVSRDGTLVFGAGSHNDETEGFVAEFPPGLLAAFDVPAAPPADPSIVGVWMESDSSEDAVLFLADGTYFHLDTGHGMAAVGEYRAGFERGRYTWDASTGQLTFATLQDTNGSVGLSGANGTMALSAVVSGDTMNVADGAFILTRAAGPAGSVVGGWVYGDPRADDASGVLVLLGDGRFMSAQDGGSTMDPSGHDGVEGGTYTWESNGLLTADVTVDTNSGWGFSNGPGAGLRTLALSADELLLGPPGPNQLRRIVDPQAVVPVITSPLTAAGIVGVPFVYTIGATHAASFGADGVPAGLLTNTTSGVISGTPLEPGTFDLTLSATSSFQGIGSATLHLVIVGTVATVPGMNVSVQPPVPTGTGPVTITFDQVSQGGETTLEVVDPAAVPGEQTPPEGFFLSDPPLYYELTTTASFSGPVTVCFDDAGVDFAGGTPRLFHFESGSWVDVTTLIDAVSSTICGVVSSLSPVAVFVQPEGIDAAPRADDLHVDVTVVRRPRHDGGSGNREGGDRYELWRRGTHPPSGQGAAGDDHDADPEWEQARGATSVRIVVSATDTDDRRLTFRIVSPPQHGIVSDVGRGRCIPQGTAGTRCEALVVYIPAPHALGFDSFTYVAGDGRRNSNVATVTMSLLPPFTTYSQQEWGSLRRGEHAGELLRANFSTLYASGSVSVGNAKVLMFTSANAVDRFLPASGRPAALPSSAPALTVDPGSSRAGAFAGHVLALRLNVDFSNAGRTRSGLAALVVRRGPLKGMTVGAILASASDVLGGSAAPPGGLSVADFSAVVERINQGFREGENSGYLRHP